MEFITAQATDYCIAHSSSNDQLLREIHDYTYQHHAEPHMLCGPLVGKFLSMISHMIKPKRILEIGTFTGYSALCLAEGLPKDGILHTIEKRTEDASIAKNFFDKSDFKDKIILHNGDAHELIHNLNESWDLIFVDADKTGYIEYYKKLIEGVQSGTFLLFDNVLFHGEVLTENPAGKSAKAIAAFNEFLKKEDRIDKVMLTVRDGITLARKK